MTARQHLYLLRFVQIMAWVVGITVLWPLMKHHGQASLMEALRFVAVLAIIFLPQPLLRMVTVARCRKCGAAARLRVDTNWPVTRHDQESPQAYIWTCETCGETETLEASWFDRIIRPRVSSSGNSSHTPHGD